MKNLILFAVAAGAAAALTKKVLDERKLKNIVNSSDKIIDIEAVTVDDNDNNKQEDNK